MIIEGNEKFLFKIKDTLSIQQEIMHFRALKDINCQLKHIAVEDRELVRIYLRAYEKTLSETMVESYVSDKNKKDLTSALEYIPCDCKTET